MFSFTIVALYLSTLATATVFITSPTGSTTFSGGKNATISWQDDGKAPSLKDFGPASVAIYAGNAQQQTQLQQIVPSVDVSTTSSIQFTPDPSIGPNSNQYFIRFQSLGAKDPSQPQFPALAFSAKFQMDSMSGQFSPEVQAQINGQSTAPLSGATSTSAPSSSAASSASRTTSGTASASRAASSASQTGKSNSAVALDAAYVKFIVALVAVAAVAFV